MNKYDSLLTILKEIHSKLTITDDFSYTGWKNQEDALNEINLHIKKLSNNTHSDIDRIKILFAPTGPLQEASFDC